MRFLAAGALGIAALASSAARPEPPGGFRLPDGDAARGKAVFVELRCHACHQVSGVDMPAPVADPAVPVVLGGKVSRARTDGELVTSIIHPSHRLAPARDQSLVRSGSLSRMGDFNESMTVRQLVDLVAFLRSTYVVGWAAGR